MKARRWLSSLAAGMLLFALGAQAQEPAFDAVVQEVRARLERELGKAPEPVQIVGGLNELIVSRYNAGRQREVLSLAQPTLAYAEKVLGPEHPDTIASVNNLAFLYESQGRYGEAEPLYQRARAASEKVLGPEHSDTLTSVSNLAALYESQGRYGEAEPLYQRALAAREKVLGPEHASTVTSVSNLAGLYESQGRYGEAEPLYRRALAAREKTLGPQHPSTLTSVSNLAGLYESQGRYGEAEPLYQRALATREKVLGPEHPSTVTSVANLAHLYESQGRYGEAEPLYQRALAAREKALGPEHPSTLTIVSNLAGLYLSQDRYGEAEPLLKRALATREKVLGPEHPNTLISVNNLAFLYKSQGRYGEAEPLYQRALAASEKVLGPEHPRTLTSVNNLAALYASQGRYREAESLYQRALAAREKALGPEHPDTLLGVNNLALLYQSQGRYGEAEPLYQRALAAHEKTLGREHPRTLISVNNLALLYQSQGRYGEAEPLYRRALVAHEKTLGREHPSTLISVSNLALLYRSQGRYGEAEPLLKRPLAAFEKTLGREHPSTLISVNNLALLYESQGRYGEAEPLYQRALAAHEKTLGLEHPNTLTSANNLAFLYGSQGRYDEAEPLYRRTLAGREKVLGPEHPDTLTTQLNLVVLLINQQRFQAALQNLRSLDPRLFARAARQLYTTTQERVRRTFLVRQSNFQDIVLTLALEHPSPETQRFAADVLLRWKLIQGEEEVVMARLLRTSSDPKVQALGRSIATLRAELSYLANRPEPDHAQVMDKQRALEAKEAELAQSSLSFKSYLEARNARADEVRAYLPSGSALLELRQYSPVNFKTGASGEPHWAALLLAPSAAEHALVFDLGPVAQSRGLWEGLAQQDDAQAAAELYRSLFGQLDAQLEGFETLYIAPDGFLSQVAFARLQLPDGRYWVQRQTLRAVQTGRHLIPSAPEPGRVPAKGLLALGEIDYRGSQQPAEKIAPDTTAREQNRALRDQLGGFGTLDHSGPEIDGIAQYYWDYQNSKPQLWKKAEASEERLKALTEPPRVLHLATHGFYLSNPAAAMQTERPMVLSGLALAGANQGLLGRLNPAGEDGILYALEVQGLNLEGTELVVLSACDAGRGTVDYSDGVYGLVRAFRTAGARHVLMTLQSVQDNRAKEFMLRFYKRWFDQNLSDPAKAMRDTQLSFIEENDAELKQPGLWAPFVLVERP